jgi:hypothetical protein
MSLQPLTELYRLFTGLSLRLRADILRSHPMRESNTSTFIGGIGIKNIPKNTNKDMQGFKHLKGKLFLER